MDKEIIDFLFRPIVQFGIGPAILIGTALLFLSLTGGTPKKNDIALVILDLIELDTCAKLPKDNILIPRDKDKKLVENIQTFSLQVADGIPPSIAIRDAALPISEHIISILSASEQTGDVKRAVPICRHAIKEEVTTTSALNNFSFPALILLSAFAVQQFLGARVFQFLTGISAEFEADFPALFYYAFGGRYSLLLMILIGIAIMGIISAFILSNCRMSPLLESLQKFTSRTPWKRKRLLRDFSTVLAIALDSGMTEKEALTLAATAVDHDEIQSKTKRTISKIEQGEKLFEALKIFDPTGNYSWRLRNALHEPKGFYRALTGWHETLQARANRDEQSFAHVSSTLMVILLGIVIGMIAMACFQMLISITNAVI